ncbi:MAG: FHA domain-containing protein [Phycisphaerales bacterium]|nr:FHA domain-containing protein [Phycisphaerales bacterium]
MAKFELLIVENDDEQVYRINGSQVTIGRNADNDIVIQEPKASRYHCALECRAGRFILKDLDSRNGTWVDGRKVIEIELANNTEFRIGRVRFQLIQRTQGTEGQGRDGSKVTSVIPSSDRSEDDMCDRLVREASSQHSLHPDRVRLDPNLQEQLFYRWQFVRLVVGVAALLVVVGGVGWFIYDRDQTHKEEQANRQQERQAHQNHIALLIEDTERKVERHLSEHHFAEADSAIEHAQAKGLPIATRVDLEEAFEARVRSRRKELYRQAEEAISTHAFEQAEKLIVKAGDLDRFIGRDGQFERHKRGLHLARVRKYLDESRAADGRDDLDAALKSYGFAKKRCRNHREIDDWAQELTRRWEPKLLDQSRRAAEKVDWDSFEEAVRVCLKTKELPRASSKVREWDEKLNTLVGGRIQINVQPEDAKIRTRVLHDGRGCNPVYSDCGTRIAGLSGGLARVLIEADGYVPAEVSADVNYPEITLKTCVLTPEAPGPLWVVNALRGQCAQALALAYYRTVGKGEPWLNALSSMSTPCPPLKGPFRRPGRYIRLKNGEKIVAKDATKGEEGLVVTLYDDEMRTIAPAQIAKQRKARSAEDLEARIEARVKLFKKKLERTDTQGFPLEVLNELGQFVETFPKSDQKLIRKCGKRFEECFARIDDGCSVCFGDGHDPCQVCKGKGRLNEKRPCKDCGAAGEKNCPQCKGDGKMDCKKCKGKGTVIESFPGRHFERRRSKKCPSCKGNGNQDCDKCPGEGKIQCQGCKGEGKKKRMGPCSACEGKGRHACKICSGSGARNQMGYKERLKLEEELAAYLRGGK